MSLLGKKILNLLNKPHKAKKSNNKMLSFDESKHIGILYTWQEESKAAFIDEFAKSINKDVSVLCYNPSKEEVKAEHPVLNITELSATGKLKSEAALTFLSKHFDFLFVLDFELNEVSKHVIIKSKANCRVGYDITDERAYFDLMIGTKQSEGITSFAKELLKYVKAISNA